MKRIDCILLVDDDPQVTFLHARLIERMGCTKEVLQVTDGRAALDLLEARKDSGVPAPEMILLDLRMPRMDGWNFLKVYEEWPEADRSPGVFIALGSPLPPHHQEAIEGYSCVRGCRMKLLSVKDFEAMLRELDKKPSPPPRFSSSPHDPHG